ncbi:MAG TPA: alpha-amylase family glycosyl hydrolase [Ignavibacteriaceae bacterium]|nr:alpha-amylase family glycosyl hydrolase [Ignavibacteriaceae bacterium]
MFEIKKNKNDLKAKIKIDSDGIKELDKYFSNKKLGSFIEKDKTFFRLFAPNALKVLLVNFHSVEDSIGNSYKMNKDKDGVWECSLDNEKCGRFYGYRVFHDSAAGDAPLCIDPYSKAVATFNTYMSPRKSLVVKENNYDWENDTWIRKDWRDLIIYEMHVRDMTAHPTSGAKKPGTYNGLIEKGVNGGINYIKQLGVNAIELLPCQEFANIEVPYNRHAFGKYNTWNPYERNHWGYMTAAFFAPESYYSGKGLTKLGWNIWEGESGRQIDDFKDMVKAFHKEGIAVIMDVVYNHISEYESGNLKEIDKKYYFRLDNKGNFIAQSGTGNDLRTEAPMMRRLIVESILYWMTEYHVDGFRFDLGKLIDWETIELIGKEAKKINPDVVLICEPWGGGYDPTGFSLRGWSSWNDQMRNGIKGENPINGPGWIFGNWYGNNDPDRIKSYVNGTLLRDKSGLFQKKEHSVNYLESHDGYTLGDFIRIALGDVKEDSIIHDIDKHSKLTPLQLKLNKLAALFLFTSQGITMIDEGQEFARSKVISRNTHAPDKSKGKIDHNSYEKDNETNYINYGHAKINRELLNYYKGLIELRNEYPAFRRADYKEINFIKTSGNPFALAYQIDHEGDKFIILFNADRNNIQEFILPEGNWEILADEKESGTNVLGEINSKIVLNPSTGAVLKKS